MRTIRNTIVGVFALAASITFAQGGKSVRPIPPELKARYQSANSAVKSGRQALKANQIQQAIIAFRQAVEIYDSIPGHHSTGNYELAKALTISGNNKAALAAYKDAVMWDLERRELAVNGPPIANVLMDYASLLAVEGKEREAKLAYYAGLRSFNLYAEGSREWIPMLVVFDQDPEMTVWKYTPANLAMTANLLKTLSSGKDEESESKRAIDIKPDWLTPLVHFAMRQGNEERNKMLSNGLSLASNPNEIRWMREYLTAVQIEDQQLRLSRLKEVSKEIAEFAVHTRKSSVTLNRSRNDLETNHHLVAVCNCEGGH